ncbi:MAG: integrase core domain-containing protein [Paludibacter sp.]|nr:integrase core domain-containing protein [Paludibacter sp.]
MPSRRIFYTHDPYENAVAERVNETLKYEYGLNKQAADLQILKKSVSQAVRIYNNERVHWSLGLRTPEEVHSSYNSLKYKSYSKKTA